MAGFGVNMQFIVILISIIPPTKLIIWGIVVYVRRKRRKGEYIIWHNAT